MSEWPKEHDWKSCVRPQRCTAGSNPALSAIYNNFGDVVSTTSLSFSRSLKNRRVTEVVVTGSTRNRFRGHKLLRGFESPTLRHLSKFKLIPADLSIKSHPES